MKKERPISYQTEERLHAYSHAFGALLSCVGLWLLLLKNSGKTSYAFASILIYGVSMIILFSASTAYHFSVHPVWKNRLRILDHISIYGLIAGTYTPVTLITLEAGNGWLMFGVVWGIALLGTGFKLFFTGRYEYISLLFYVFMGWLIVFDLKNLMLLTSRSGLLFLALGGAFYTLGIFFYVMRRIPYNHLIWHILVLAGAISHWWYIYREVV